MKAGILFLIVLILFSLPVVAQTRIEATFPDIGGLTPPHARPYIQNDTPLQAHIFVLKKDMGWLEPGGSIYDKEPVPFEGMPTPVIALFYYGEEYVGVAANVLRLHKGSPAGWIIRLDQILWVDGRYQYLYYNTPYGSTPPPYPFPDYGKSREEDFPRIIQFLDPTSTTAVIAINNSFFTGQLKFNGVPVKELGTGDFHVAKWTTLMTAPEISYVTKMDFVDRGRFIAASEAITIPLARGAPVAYIIIFGPHGTRRY